MIDKDFDKTVKKYQKIRVVAFDDNRNYRVKDIHPNGVTMCEINLSTNRFVRNGKQMFISESQLKTFF